MVSLLGLGAGGLAMVLFMMQKYNALLELHKTAIQGSRAQGLS